MASTDSLESKVENPNIPSTLKWDCSNCKAANSYNIECTGCKTACTKEHRDKVISNTKEILDKYSQSQVLSHISDIKSNTELNKLLSQIYTIDFDEINNLYKRAMSEEKDRQDLDLEEKKENKNKTETMKPFPHSDAFNINSIGDINKLCTTGFKNISQGKCSVIILAGGQGTRLGFNKPKGCYEIGAISKKSIYQLVLEKMISIKNTARKTMNIPSDVKIFFPIYFMTSEATHYETFDYLEKNKYFGCENVTLFKQKLFPCLEELTGKFIMKTPSEIAMSPNGNGGIYSSLILNGIFDNMCKRGIEYIQIFGIDNILARIGDPLWFGHMIESNIDSSNKTCIKKEPHEKVGVMCLKYGKPFVTEYTELTKEMVELKQKDNSELEYCYGNLAMHMFSVNFLKKICYDKSNKYALPIHVARKQIPFYDSKKKETIKPADKNGIKLEFFVFDTYQYSEKCTVYNILRNEEFAPVKNKNEVGKDSPLTATIAYSNFWKQQIIKHGGKFDNDDYNNDKLFCEVSPLFAYLPYSYDNDEFKKRVNGKTFTLPFYFN